MSKLSKFRSVVAGVMAVAAVCLVPSLAMAQTNTYDFTTGLNVVTAVTELKAYIVAGLVAVMGLSIGMCILFWLFQGAKRGLRGR